MTENEGLRPYLTSRAEQTHGDDSNDMVLMATAGNSSVKQPPFFVPPSYHDTTQNSEPLPLTIIQPEDLDPNDRRLGLYGEDAEDEDGAPERAPEMEAAPDGGWGWLIVLAAFFNNMVLDGIAYSCGVYFPVFLREFEESASKTAWIGSLCSGCYLAISPLAAAATNILGCRVVSLVGCLWAAASLALASFASSVDILILSFGISTGLAFGFLYLPSLVIVGLWFEKKRGVATGITVAGSGVGMFVLPPLCTLMIDHWGWRFSMYGLAAMVFLCAPLAMLYRPVPPNFRNGQSKKAKVKSAGTHHINKEVELNGHKGQDSSPTEEEDANSYSETSVDDRAEGEIPEIRVSDFEKRGSSQSVAFAASSGRTGRGKNEPMLLKKAMMNRKKTNGLCQSMTTVNCSQTESQAAQPQLSKTLEDLSDRTFENSEYGNGSAHLQHSSARLSGFEMNAEIKNEIRNNRGRPSNVSHLSVSAAEPLRKKDLFYSVSTINLSTGDMNNNNNNNEGTRERNGSALGDLGDIISEHEDQKLHRKLHNNKFVNGLMNMLGLEIFKDRCFIMLLVSSVVGFLGFFAPFGYLSAFAAIHGIDANSASFLISIIGISNTIGRPLFGLLVSLKILDCVRLMNWAMIVAGCCTIVLPFLTSYWTMASYSAIFGLVIAGHVCMKSLAIVQLMGVDRLTNGLGYCLLFMGLAAMLGGPLLGLLYNEESKSYMLCFVFAGVLLILGGLLGLPMQTISTWQKSRMERRRPGRNRQIVLNNPRDERTTTANLDV